MCSLNLSRAQPIGEIELPKFPGCYVLVVDSEGVEALGFNRKARRAALYVGKAEDNIRNRVNDHLLVGGSGSSSIRRSIGALLREQYDFNPQPRSRKRSDSKRFTNYKFDRKGEEIISDWIFAYVYFLSVKSSNPKETEDLLVSEHHPLLNLTGWPNPERAIIKSERAECARLARFELGA